MLKTFEDAGLKFQNFLIPAPKGIETLVAKKVRND